MLYNIKQYKYNIKQAEKLAGIYNSLHKANIEILNVSINDFIQVFQVQTIYVSGTSQLLSAGII